MAPYYDNPGQVNDEALSISNGRTYRVVQLADGDGNIINPTQVVTGLEIPPHNYIGMTYTGSNLTGVIYKTGGSAGTTVATLTLVYDGSNNLISVTRS